MRLLTMVPFFILASYAYAQDQKVSDAEVDAQIARLAAGPGGIPVINSSVYQNMPRVVWNYKRANGSLRARILAAMNSGGSSISPILELAIKEREPELRAMAASILAGITYGRSIQRRNELFIPMRRDSSVKVRKVVARGLRWGVPKNEQWLVPMLKDQSQPVRVMAALSLADKKDMRALPVLVKNLGYVFKWDSGEIGGEDNVWLALSRFGTPVIPYIEPYLNSTKPLDRWNAVSILTSIRAPKTFEYGKRLRHDPDPMVRIFAYQAIAWDRKLEAIPLLIEGLSDKGKVKGQNTFVNSNVEYCLSGITAPENPKFTSPWVEGRAALEAYRKSH